MLKYFAEVAILHLLVSPVVVYFVVLGHYLAHLAESEKTRLVNLHHLVIAVVECFLALGNHFVKVAFVEVVKLGHVCLQLLQVKHHHSPPQLQRVQHHHAPPQNHETVECAQAQ